MPFPSHAGVWKFFAPARACSQRLHACHWRCGARRALRPRNASTLHRVSARPPAVPVSPASSRCPALPLPWSGRRSPTTTPSLTSCTIPTAPSTPPISFRPFGQAKKARSSCGHGFWPPMLRTPRASPRRRPPLCIASTILAGVKVFFLLLLNFAAPPFSIQPGPTPLDGNGLNPLLQYPEMVIHPRCSISATWALPSPSPSLSAP